MKFNKLAKYTLLLMILAIISFIVLAYFYDSKTTLNNNTNTNSNNNTPTIQDINSEYYAFFCPENDCNTILYDYLSNAKTIDCAIYDITLNWIYDTIKDKNTRIITDNDQLTDYGRQFNFVKTDSSPDYMHNKFCILDSNLLLIGSLNFTLDAITKQNNNFIVTNNIQLIKETQSYFDNLWKGQFNYGATYNNSCFSPSNCINKYIEHVKNSKENIKCMFFSFTFDALGQELINAKEKGIDVKLILEKSQNSQYSEYDKLKENNVNVIWDNNPSYMHNKFCVFDNSIVITGSMNPSNNGNINNNESIIIINNKEIANQYTNYFNKYYSIWR